MARNFPLRFILTAAALTGALALEGCGRKGFPEAPSTVAAPADHAGVDPAANKAKPPGGFGDPALKAGARKEATPFDFLL